jgi:hypothetical protein
MNSAIVFHATSATEPPGSERRETSPMLTNSRADFDVRTDLKKRTIFTRMTGVFSEGDMQAWAKEYREATDRFRIPG